MSHGTGDQPSSDDLSRSVGQSSSSTVTDNHSFHVEWLSERFAESVRTSDRTESGSSSSNRLDAFKRWRNLLDRTLQERQEIRRLWALERQRKVKKTRTMSYKGERGHCLQTPFYGIVSRGSASTDPLLD